MIDPTVRRADPDAGDDLEQLALLERESRAALVDARGGQRWLCEHPEIAGEWRARCEGSQVWVAHIDEVVVGYLVADHGTDGVLRIDQVWVTPEAREIGFGDTLLGEAMEWGRAQGAVAVEGQALPGDRHTKNLYERAGIVARLITTFRWL
jgi:GNAT superfamily N-acetyltransferase